ncbi:trypsin-like peptidase domain-containing protein [Candidatus Woesearchaeota archaeon]|nr:trypsin-like peptidase domain-containing protein [Candidatus Woesearchaeota archaeon]
MSLKKLVTAGILSGFIMASGAQSLALPERRPQEQQLEQAVSGYDFNNQHLTAETIQQMLNSTVEITVEAVYKRRTVDLNAVMNALEAEQFTSQELKPGRLGDLKDYNYGSGVVISKDGNSLEVLTAAHLKMGIAKLIVQPFTENLVQVLTLSEINYYVVEKLQKDRFGNKIINERNSIKLSSVKSNDTMDLMFLKSGELGDERVQNYEATKLLAEESELMQGNVVYVVGYPGSVTGREIRHLNKQLTEGIITGGIKNPAQGLENFLETSASVSTGNSGGPAFVFKDGTPYLTGIVRGMPGGTNEIYLIVRPKSIKEFLHPRVQSNNPLQNYIPFQEIIPKGLLEPQNNQDNKSGEDAAEPPQGQ